MGVLDVSCRLEDKVIRGFFLRYIRCGFRLFFLYVRLFFFVFMLLCLGGGGLYN